jgi:hypothetical protein
VKNGRIIGKFYRYCPSEKSKHVISDAIKIYLSPKFLSLNNILFPKQ